MPPLLRSKGPLCHYCNRWSSSKNRGVQHFQCENCLAENFLDEHGEIADVPAEETCSPRQLARPWAKRLQEDQIIAPTTTFCSTCLKNQHLLTETLANYLPSPDDPTYDQYEASYPAFRQQLEERYPPVCARCEPEARRRIQQAGYTAKSDHLRRMMERSRIRRIASRWGWRSLVVTSGAVFFWTSITGQLAWNLIGALEDPRKNSGPSDKALATSSAQCVAQIFKDRRTHSGCAVASAPIGLLAVAFGLVSCWWNPKWQHKLQGREGRLTGLREYYQVNTAVLLARFGFWVWARDYSTVSSENVAQKAAHAMGMMMTLVLTIYAFTRVKFDTTMLVSWQDSPLPLLSQRQYKPPITSDIDKLSLPSSASRLEAPIAKSFPISSLATGPSRQIWQAPTPPPDEDPDAMEWEPSQKFEPKPRRPEVHANPGPSPFHGALPAMPTNRLLHPQPQRQIPQKEAIGLPPGFFDKRDRLLSESEAASLPLMAQPKFFGLEDREADTGLENIFDAVFSIRDAPAVPKAESKQTVLSEPAPPREGVSEFPHSASGLAWKSSIKLNLNHVAKLFIYAISLVVWYAALELQPKLVHLDFLVLCFAGSVSLSLAISEKESFSRRPDTGDLIPLVIIVFGAILLALRQWSLIGKEAKPKDDRLGMILLFLCICWELPRLLDWNPARSSKDMLHPHLRASSFHEPQSQVSIASEVDVQRQNPSSNEKTWQPSSSETLPAASTTSRWQPEHVSQVQPAPTLQAQEQRPFNRTRSDSTDSAASQSSIATTASSTTAGLKTPNLRPRHFAGLSGQSPGFNLRSLALDDGVPTPRCREKVLLGNRSRKI